MNDMSLLDGRRVEVLLHGDDTWYLGVVVKGRKMWVELDAKSYPNGGYLIADENNIREWRIER